MTKIITLYILILISTFSYGQQLFEGGTIYGGVTGVGFSTGGGSGTVNSIVQIPPNSTIKKSFLIATTDSTPPHNHYFK